MTVIAKVLEGRTILVTACGGDIGLGIGKILRETLPHSLLVGCDVQDDHGGQFIFNHCDKIARADAPTYLEELIALVKHRQADLVIPTSEAEITAISSMERKAGSAPLIVMASREAVAVGLDKLTTARFLSSQGLTPPWTVDADTESPLAFPCILKPRAGRGSRGIIKIEDAAMAAFWSCRSSRCVWQEYLRPDNEEYTCGVFRSRQGVIRTIVLRRTLARGLTGKGEVIDNVNIDSILIRIANSLKLVGSINVQLRLTADGPRVFEINPRFSSTVVFRHLLGFQDLIWSIQDVLAIPCESYTPPPPGSRFYRGSLEHIAFHKQKPSPMGGEPQFRDTF